jgi:hypothetical protein
MMKKILLIVILIFCKTVAFTQDSTSYASLFSNARIQYRLIQKSDLRFSNTPTKYYFDVTLSKNQQQYLLCQPFDFWESKLQDTTSDWATNIVLYYLYEKDAFLYAFIFTDRNKFLAKKNDEINFWKDFINEKFRSGK